MLKIFGALIALSLFAFCNPALSEVVPTKKIRVYNNGVTPLYIYLQSPVITEPDLWMQAQFKVSDWDANFASQRKFQTSRLRRAYFEAPSGPKGIKPNGWLEITLPFYTQLKATTPDNLGKVKDQFVDWWNANRLYIFDSDEAYHSAQVTNNNDKPPAPGGGLPPPPVVVFSESAVPTCVWSDGGPCSVKLFESAINAPDGIPFELQEFTFASAEGPPLNKNLPPPTRTKIDLDRVNYNVSSLDSVYLPVAMGPLAGETPSTTAYVGTGLTTSQFRKTLNLFAGNGSRWPFYIPVYYDDVVRPGFPSTNSKACSLAPFPQTQAYKLPKLPGAFNVFTASYLGSERGAPPIPPVLSSNPANWKTVYSNNACIPSSVPPFIDPPALGATGVAMLDLWTKCLNGVSDASETCRQIRGIVDIFRKSFAKTCANTPTPPLDNIMQAVYGWVPIVYRGCRGADLVTVPGFAPAQTEYCKLQYNYLTLPGAQKQYIFNPYTALIHSPAVLNGLASSSYAFSIDDKLSFKSVPAQGVVIAISGLTGLSNKQATPLPTKDTIFDHCKEAGQ